MISGIMQGGKAISISWFQIIWDKSRLTKMSALTLTFHKFFRFFSCCG